MSRIMTVSDSIVVAADATTLWTAIADPTQMPRWSPENTGAKIPEPRPLSVGDEFVGTNKRFSVRWVTRCRVTVADPGKVFEFHVFRWGFGRPFLKLSVATWRYTFEEAGDGTDGTLVTETWTDGRRAWPAFAANAFDFFATGGKTFARFQRWNIARTLAQLQRDFAR